MRLRCPSTACGGHLYANGVADDDVTVVTEVQPPTLGPHLGQLHGDSGSLQVKASGSEGVAHDDHHPLVSEQPCQLAGRPLLLSTLIAITQHPCHRCDWPARRSTAVAVAAAIVSILHSGVDADPKLALVTTISHPVTVRPARSCSSSSG